MLNVNAKILTICHLDSFNFKTGFLKSFPEGQSADEFSSNPDQTHLRFSNNLEDSD